MLLAEVVTASDAVGATRSRNAKRDLLAELLAAGSVEEIEVAVAMLTGQVRQGRIGIGWAAISELEGAPAPHPVLTVLDVDTAISRLADTTGPGSQTSRRDQLAELWSSATGAEQQFLGRLFVGELRQGALGGVMVDAIAKAAGVPGPLVRRATMLCGDLATVASIALTEGAVALRAVGVTVGRAIEPMLASSATSVAEAINTAGTASVEWKLDGARVQVHRSGKEVRVFTRNLNDISERSPDLVQLTRQLDCVSAVLDGEVLGLDPDGRPRAFQDTMSGFGADDATAYPASLTTFFFDLLHLDGRDLIDEPLDTRHELLDRLVPEPRRVPRLRTDDPDAGHVFFSAAVSSGHEGVMVKSVDSTYEAGRRGKAWLKVKPVHTYDLVVLAAEWGHGRRTGWLSNLHLGARDGEDFVMVGKTFKGLTDEMLAWQTDRLSAIAESETRGTVWVRPELVVEIAIDGVQRSTRYPGGIALRFARVKAYRTDKSPETADTLGTLRELAPNPGASTIDPE